MATKLRLFTDLDLSMTKHPATKDLVAKYDDNAIKNAVKNLVLTKHYERHFHSEIGSNAESILFDLVGPMAEEILKREITNVINNFEPRVNLQSVECAFQSANNAMLVNIVYTIKNMVQLYEVELTLYRAR